MYSENFSRILFFLSPRAWYYLKSFLEKSNYGNLKKTKKLFFSEKDLEKMIKENRIKMEF